MVQSIPRYGRKHYGTSLSRERYDHTRRQSCNTAIASFARALEQGDGHQPQDRSEVAQRQTVEGVRSGRGQDRTLVSVRGPFPGQISQEPDG